MRTTTKVALQPSSSADRDYGRHANAFVARLLADKLDWQMQLTAIGSKADVDDKIDGTFTSGDEKGKTVQIACRVGTLAREDFAVQVVAKQPDEHALLGTDLSALMSAHSAKLQAKAEIHIMLNADRTAIHIADAARLRVLVDFAVGKMKNDATIGGEFTSHRRSYREPSTGVELRISESTEGWSVLAYIPAARGAFRTVPVTPSEVDDARRAVTR